MQNKRNSILFIIICVFFLVLAGGCYIPIVKKEVTIPFFEKSPDKVLPLMMEKMANLKSYRLKNSLNLSGEFPIEGNMLLAGSDNFSLETVFEAEFDNSDKYEAKRSGLLSLNLKAGILNIEAAIENIGIGRINYYKIKKLPSLLLNIYEAFSIDKDNWYKFDDDELKKTIKKENYNTKIEFNINDIDKIPETKEKIKDLIKSHKVFEFVERLRDEKIGGKKNYHYKFILNKNNLKSFSNELLNVIVHLPSEKNTLAKEAIEDNIDEYIGALNKIGKAEGEIWIDKKYFYLNKVDFYAQINDEKQEKLAGLNIKLEFANFNEELGINEPENSESLNEIIEKMLEDEKILAENKKRRNDIQDIKYALRSYFNGNKEYPSALESLKGEYLPQIPKDPDTGKIYMYLHADNPVEAYEIKYYTVEKAGNKQFYIATAYTNNDIIVEEKRFNNEEFEIEIMEKYEDAKKIDDIRGIQTALELYFNDNE